MRTKSSPTLAVIPRRTHDVNSLCPPNPLSHRKGQARGLVKRLVVLPDRKWCASAARRADLYRDFTQAILSVDKGKAVDLGEIL